MHDEQNLQIQLNSINPEDVLRPVVQYVKHGPIARVTLTRPHVCNALNLQMHRELKAVWDDFEADELLKIAVLTGAGDRAFSSGQDLKELAHLQSKGILPTSIGSSKNVGSPRLTERHHLIKPVVARVNGFAIGGGFELALACDLIIASEEAYFSFPEAALGLIPGAGGLFRLTRQIPPKVAMGYLLTGRKMTARRAYELGLVNEVVPISQLDDCTDAWVDDILRCSPISIRALKDIAGRSAHLSLEEAFATQYEIERIRLQSDDCKEGPLAFVEKRRPNWA